MMRKVQVATMSALEQTPTTDKVARVEVSRIHHYARNPRRQPNPEYARIKASIQAEGLDQPLVLSQKPGESEYVLHSGGNTRLKILKELWEETGEERFRWVDCVVRTWSQESNVLFAHLRENELRGGLPFIDKALAVFEAKALLEQELAVDSLSQRQLEELFKERGFGLSHSMISKMGYAVDVLWPLMPKALAAGLGRPQVERIRALQRAAQTIWKRRELGDDADFEGVFAELCRRHDGAEWDIQPLHDALVNEIAVESEQNRQVIHLEMDACLAGRPFDFPDNTLDDQDDGRMEEVESVASTDSEQNVGEDMPAHAPAEAESTPKTNSTGKFKDIGALRDQLCHRAEALAAAHGLSAVVKPLPDQGLGFLLIDVPPQELRDVLDPDALGLVSALWWQLAASSELTSAPVDCVLAHLDQDSTLYQALASHDAELLFGSVWTPDPGHLSSQLWQQLNPPDWQSLLQMMEAYRSLKRLAFDTGIELWENAETECDVVE